MIIIDPDEIGRAQERRQLLRKPAIDVEIGGAFAPVVVGQMQPIVKQRPQGAIGIAVVIAGVVLWGEIEGGVRNSRLVHDGRRGGPLYAGTGAAAPAEPEPAGGAQGRE